MPSEPEAVTKHCCVPTFLNVILFSLEDDLSNKDMSCPQLLRAQLNLHHYTTKMETSTPIQVRRH